MPENRIIDLIYDSIVDDGAFVALPEAIAGITGSDSSWMMAGLPIGGQGGPPLISSVHGVDDGVVAEYVSNEHLRDPWVAAAHHVRIGVATSMTRHVSKEAFMASPIYNEFIRGRCDVMHCMALAVEVEGSVVAWSMHRGRKAAEFGEADERGLDVLRPHLIRLLRARELRRRNGFLDASPYDALLIGRDPTVLCDQDGRIVHLNVPAVDLIDRHTVLGRTPANRLCSIANAIPIERTIRDAAVRRVPSTHVQMHAGCRWAFRIDPAASGAVAAIVVVRNVTEHVRAQVLCAAERFGFTPAETALAQSLAAGLSAEQHAANRHLKMPTVRNQLAALLSKSECGRQAQLVGTLLETPPGRNG